ncbi:hypothetical protein QJS10_CPB11g01595 [Acorus calamus]|uniref:Uncharacterized protein n=1 Tax=Acorus calamus TaxID=4465 RepID=A0AAV9DVC5_ACOCL|nr:hypothetical protein QJS10_CPB11g01595 [Acorus calamus]
MNKLNGILKKCKSLSKLGRSSSYSSLRSKSTREEEEDGGNTVVYVGSSRRRYVISSKHLDHPLFSALIDRSTGNGGVISVRCEVVLFDHLLWMLENTDLEQDSGDGEGGKGNLSLSKYPTSIRKENYINATASVSGDEPLKDEAGFQAGLSFVFYPRMVRQLLEKNDKGHVVATCRNPDQAVGLVELKRKYTERLNVLQLDITNESAIEASANSIREKYGSLNLLINASGVLSIPDVLQPETTLSKVQKSALLLTYEINAVGPILVIKHMWPLLKVGGGSGTDREFAVVANLSARVGSIGDNGLGGWHSYRSSKTALNQYIEFFGTNIFPIHAVTKTIAVEFARKKDPIVCILLHPGTVDTDLSRPFQRNVPQVGVQGHWEPHRDLAEPGDLTEKPILHPRQGFDTVLHTLAHCPSVRDGGQALSELIKVSAALRSRLGHLASYEGQARDLLHRHVPAAHDGLRGLEEGGSGDEDGEEQGEGCGGGGLHCKGALLDNENLRWKKRDLVIWVGIVGKSVEGGLNSSQIYITLEKDDD